MRPDPIKQAAVNIAGASLRLVFLICITMTAFAANSILGRMALGSQAIDPAGYTLVRLTSGAVMLALMIWWRNSREANRPSLFSRIPGTWTSAAALFAYAITFSLGFVRIDTGAGTLIQFACVQCTMIGWGIMRGERLTAFELTGLGIASGAMIWLFSPGIAAPDLPGSLFIGASGIAWGIYSLRGRGQPDPLAATGGNFIRTVPMAIVLLAVLIDQFEPTLRGVLLAATSGAITSAMGYALWYRVLKDLSATRGAIVQFSVPIIAAAGGVALMGEELTFRLVVSGTLILGGVALAILAKQRR